MPYSQNGWLGLRTAQQQAEYLTTITIPGTDPVRKFRVRKGDVARCFEWLISRFHREVESLNEGHPNDDWSFAYRSVRAGASLSNHASGTAVDLNATQHPLGTSPTANFTAGQRSAIRRILNDADGVFRWGGDYSGRKDPMHFEINTGPAGVDALARKLAAATPTTPKDGIDGMSHYYADLLEPLDLVAGAERHLVFNRDGEAWMSVVNGGADGTEFDVTLGLVFTGFDSPMWGRARFLVYNDDGDLHYAFPSEPFQISPPDAAGQATFPGRTAVIKRSGRVYPHLFLRVGVVLEGDGRLEDGRADVLYKES